jgi:hypothetical protein
MAIVRTLIIATLSGLMGSVEFAATRHGQVARPARISCRSQTPDVLYERTRFTELTQVWKTLPVTDRAAWATAAGSLPLISLSTCRYAMSGFHLFLACQPDWRYIPTHPTLAAVPTARTPAPDSVTATFSATGAYTITVTGAYPKGFDAWDRVYAARYRPTPGAPQPKCWREIGTFLHNGTDDYKAYFALKGMVFQPGDHIAVAVQCWWNAYFPAMPITAYCTVAP